MPGLRAAILIPVLLARAASAAVSYHGEIAPIFAFHCNRCHGDEGPAAGGLDTRSYTSVIKGGNLGQNVVPGDPDASLLVQFLEGRRGAGHRMPLQAPPLAKEQIDAIRRWITESAREDRDTGPKYRMSLPGVRLAPISCRLPGLAYVVIELLDAKGRVLHRETGSGMQFRWDLRPEKGWPGRITVRAAVLYAVAPPEGAELCVGKVCTRITAAGA